MRPPRARTHGGATATREDTGDIPQYDVPYYLGVAMDNDILGGLWYTMSFAQGEPAFTQLTAPVKRADPVVMVFNVEMTKVPRPGDGPGEDDLVYGGWTGVLDHEEGDCERGY